MKAGTGGIGGGGTGAVIRGTVDEDLVDVVVVVNSEEEAAS